MTVYPALNIIFPEKEIFLRLGGHLTKTGISPEYRQKFLSAAHQAFELCRPQGAWEIFPVSSVGKEGITLADDSFIPGSRFAEKNPSITHLWCAAVTVGKEVISLRDNEKKISAAAVFDAVAAESADAAMDLVQKLAAQELLRRGMRLNERRYSPGYGDMPLDVQQFFADKKLLASANIGLNENFYMTPEKSVTAFAGITIC